MPWTSTVPSVTAGDRVEAAREGMRDLVGLLDELLDKLEKQYEEVDCRDRERNGR